MGSRRVKTRLSDFTFTFHSHALEKEMATHSSVLAWRIPGMGAPAVYGVAQSRTRLTQLSSSSNYDFAVDDGLVNATHPQAPGFRLQAPQRTLEPRTL